MKERLYINGQAINISESNQINEGGEAYLYAFEQGRLLKVFREPDNFLYEGDKDAQDAARNRIKTHQTKLPDFPKNLPSRVIVPQAIARDEDNRILGYSMRFIENATELYEYTDEAVRREHNVTNESVLGIFRDLHHTVSDTHEADVVIGDFNDTNVLVKDEEAYLIDTDSFIFGKYQSSLFQPDFLDPMLVDPKAKRIEIINGKRQTTDSDWYAYNTMLIQNLLLAKPHGGLYTPNPNITKKERLEQRITIFNNQVELSGDVIHYDMLPDELLQHFQEVFEKDKRGQFPAYLLDMRWTTCRRCGAEHARNVCPKHSTSTRKKSVEHGGIQALTIFERNPGFIIASEYQKEQLRYLYHENGEYRREDGSILHFGDFNPSRKYELDGKITFEKSNDLTLKYDPSALRRQSVINLAETETRINDVKYWISHCKLWRQDKSENITSSGYVEGQAMFWVGDDLGLLCINEATGLKPKFIFDAHDVSSQNFIDYPIVKGNVVDSTCYFDKKLAWLLISIENNGETINHCLTFNQKGNAIAKAIVKARSNTWLGMIHGKCADGNSLLTPTDKGIKRFTIDNKNFITDTDVDTIGFVDSNSSLLHGKDGIYVVNAQKIIFLQRERDLENQRIRNLVNLGSEAINKTLLQDRRDSWSNPKHAGETYEDKMKAFEDSLNSFLNKCKKGLDQKNFLSRLLGFDSKDPDTMDKINAKTIYDMFFQGKHNSDLEFYVMRLLETNSYEEIEKNRGIVNVLSSMYGKGSSKIVEILVAKSVKSSK